LNGLNTTHGHWCIKCSQSQSVTSQTTSVQSTQSQSSFAFHLPMFNNILRPPPQRPLDQNEVSAGELMIKKSRKIDAIIDIYFDTWLPLRATQVLADCEQNVRNGNIVKIDTLTYTNRYLFFSKTMVTNNLIDNNVSSADDSGDVPVGGQVEWNLFKEYFLDIFVPGYNTQNDTIAGLFDKMIELLQRFDSYIFRLLFIGMYEISKQKNKRIGNELGLQIRDEHVRRVKKLFRINGRILHREQSPIYAQIIYQAQGILESDPSSNMLNKNKWNELSNSQ